MANKPACPTPLRVPVIEEGLHVGKRLTDTGKGVRLHKTVSEEAWRIDETLMQHVPDMTRVPIGQWISSESLPVQRQEGQTLIIPVLEEVLVVEKRIRLKEEIRITVKTVAHPASEHVVLRKEQVHAERFDDTAINSPPSFEGDRND